MYSVLVVDDEEIIREGLRSQVQRIHHPEVGEVLLAYNGLEGERLAREAGAGIIITDIKMPDITGLEFIKRISDIKDKFSIIVLSGYDDYSYVREAFRLGAVDYLLKPVNFNELKERLESSILKLKESNVSQMTVENLEEKGRSTYVLEAKINRLLGSNSIPEENLKEMYGEMRSHFPHQYFCLCLLGLEESMRTAKDNVRVENFLQSWNTELFRNQSICIEGMHDFRGNYLVIFNLEQQDCYPELVHAVKEFVHEIKRDVQWDITAAISRIGEGLQSFSTVYKEVVKALTYRILLDQSGEVIEYKGILEKKNDILWMKKEVDEFAVHLQSGTSGKISQFIDQTFTSNRLKDQSVESVKRLYESVLQKVYELQNGQQIEEAGKDFYSFQSLVELRFYLKDYLYKACQKWMDYQNREKTVVEIAKRYIEENYAKDIAMAEVANLVSMNYSYFSKLFKDKTGMTFSGYLMKIRLEEARQLLKDPVNRVNVIAEKVGYDNSFHFSRAFKKYFGVSPKDFRK